MKLFFRALDYWNIKKIYRGEIPKGLVIEDESTPEPTPYLRWRANGDVENVGGADDGKIRSFESRVPKKGTEDNRYLPKERLKISPVSKEVIRGGTEFCVSAIALLDKTMDFLESESYYDQVASHFIYEEASFMEKAPEYDIWAEDLQLALKNFNETLFDSELSGEKLNVKNRRVAPEDILKIKTQLIEAREFMILMYHAVGKPQEIEEQTIEVQQFLEKVILILNSKHFSEENAIIIKKTIKHFLERDQEINIFPNLPELLEWIEVNLFDSNGDFIEDKADTTIDYISGHQKNIISHKRNMHPKIIRASDSFLTQAA